MPVSEERLQFLLPKRLKAELQKAAAAEGISVGEYIRRLISARLGGEESRHSARDFPFGENPISTGRRRGSVEHDRPGE